MVRAPAHYRLEFDPRTLKMRSCLGWSENELQGEQEFVTRRAALEGGQRGEFFWVFPPAEARDVSEEPLRRVKRGLQPLLSLAPAACRTDLDPPLPSRRRQQRRWRARTEGPGSSSTPAFILILWWRVRDS